MNHVALHPPAEPRVVRAPVLFAGWYVVAGAFVVLMVGYGAIYSYAAFAEAIAAEFGAIRAEVSLVYALSGAACFFTGVLSGPLADRLGARVLAAAGMLLVGTGLLVAAAARSLVEVYLGYGLLIGLGVGFAYVPAVAVVQCWFTVHRGLASGIAVSGIGIGTALVPPAADALGALGDWRTAFAICGALAVPVGLVGAMLLAPPPSMTRTAAVAEEIGVPPAALPVRTLVLIYAGTLLASMPAAAPHALLVGTALDLGLPRQDAVGLLGLIGLGTILGRFVLAALADALGRRAVFLACCAGMAASMLAWAAAASEPALVAFALGFGALQGGFVALLPAHVADLVGPRVIGGLLGLLYTGRGIALLVAPPAVAFGIASLGGHALAVSLLALVGLAGAAMLAAATPARRA
ncbi:MFS transporter [Roseomonas sp. AR75]|uniref:MFS transporter n=1 Tax=Roseomonas sp. AR75 TaxID=2562311 RepID=UPI0010C1504B|nr:MFS transporter [Roseomonas sp. AR75]